MLGVPVGPVGTGDGVGLPATTTTQGEPDGEADGAADDEDVAQPPSTNGASSKLPSQ